MTKQQTPPAPLGVCDSCGNTPALPEPGGRSVYCSACMRREVLQNAAAEQLRDMLTPLLGAWAQHWNAAGLSPEALAGVLSFEADRQQRPARSRRPFLTITRALLRFHRPPPYVDPGPARYTVRLEQLPTLAQVRPPEPPEYWTRYTVRQPDGTRREHSPAPGLDLLTLELPDGSAVLLPLGYRGTLEPERKSAVRVPASERDAARGLYFASHEPVPAELLERGEVLA